MYSNKIHYWALALESKSQKNEKENENYPNYEPISLVHSANCH